VKADHAFRDASSLDNSSGTTALIALVLGRWATYKSTYRYRFFMESIGILVLV
jgi:hypothetical protein